MINLRQLENNQEDEALGLTLVKEYVEATAQEMSTPGEPPMSLEQLLPYMSDLQDFGGRYHAGGAFLVAFENLQAAGCVGICPATAERCEMNRLWVRSGFRQLGLGRTLVQASLDKARELGFKTMSLDVLTSRQGARQLYEKLGFKESPGYHDYPFAMASLERLL